MFTDAGEGKTSSVLPDKADEEFHVRCERSANWVVRRIVEGRSYRRRVQEWAERETRRAQRRERFLLLRFGGELEDWARQQIAASHEKRRSVNLPAGVVGFRAERPRLMVADEATLLRWCRTHMPAAVRTVERVLIRPISDHVAETGELPDGTEINAPTERFYVK